MSVAKVLFCCNPSVASPGVSFGGAFAGLNVLMEDTIQYINSGYSPTYENIRFTTHQHGLQENQISYIENCTSADFYCVFEKHRCNDIECENIDDATEKWKEMSSFSQTREVANVIFQPILSVRNEIKRLNTLVPLNFTSLHIRRGDKLLAKPEEEISTPDASFFAGFVENSTSSFIASDDSEFASSVKLLRPDHDIWTVVRKHSGKNQTIREIVVNVSNELQYLYILTQMLSKGNPFVFSSISNVPIFSLYSMNHSNIVDIEGVIDASHLTNGDFVCSPAFGGRSGICKTFPQKQYIVETLCTSSILFVCFVMISPILFKYAMNFASANVYYKKVIMILWMIASCCTIIFNKILADISHPIVVVITQMCYTFLIAFLNLDQRPSYANMVKWVTHVSLLFPIQLSSSIIALRYASVGAYIVVRNTSPVIVLLIEKRQCSERQLIAGLVIVISSILFQSQDMSSSVLGVVFLFINLVSASAERMLTKHLLSRTNMSNTWAIFLNNSMFILLFLILVIYEGGFLVFRHFHRTILETNYAYALIGSLMSVIAVSFSGVILQRNILASTFLAMSSFNKTFLIFLSMVLFSEHYNVLATIGMFANLIACIVFSAYNENASPVCFKKRYALAEDDKKSVDALDMHQNKS